MKKKITICICLALVILLAGCEDTTYSPKTTEPELQTTFYELPFDVPYEDSFFAVTKLQVYESEVDYEYRPYCILTLDVSKLSDKQATYLYKSDLDFNARIYCKDDTLYLSRVYTVFFKDVKEIRLYCTHVSAFTVLRDSVDGSDFVFELRAAEDPRFKSTKDLPYYSYRGTFAGPLDPLIEMDPKDYDYFLKGVKARFS